MDHEPYLGQSGVNVTTKAAIRAGEIEYKGGYREALTAQRAWERVLNGVLRSVDFIALPTIQGPPLRKPLFTRSPLFEIRAFEHQNTVPVNLAGNPAIAIPIKSGARGFPVTSLQLVGRPRSEAELLNAARLVSEADL